MIGTYIFLVKRSRSTMSPTEKLGTGNSLMMISRRKLGTVYMPRYRTITMIMRLYIDILFMKTGLIR